MGDNDPEAASKALPAGSLLALYLEPAPQSDSSVKVNEGNAGHPAGTALWQADAQAFTVADGPAGGIVLPALGEVRPERSFASQLPRGAVPRQR